VDLAIARCRGPANGLLCHGLADSCELSFDGIRDGKLVVWC
jgi:hypothetical protein